MKILAFLAIFSLGLCFQVVESKVLGCVVDGVAHKMGEVFVNKECTGRCKCLKPISGDTINYGHGCVSLCGQFYIRCGPGKKKVNYKVPYPGSNCTCTQEKCVPEECEHNGEYKTGGTYYSEDCTKKCFCMSSETPSPCQPSGHDIYLACRCPKVTYQRPIPGTKCTCPDKKCVPYEGKGAH